jgi:hypothetical protein
VASERPNPRTGLATDQANSRWRPTGDQGRSRPRHGRPLPPIPPASTFRGRSPVLAENRWVRRSGPVTDTGPRGHAAAVSERPRPRRSTRGGPRPLPFAFMLRRSPARDPERPGQGRPRSVCRFRHDRHRPGRGRVAGNRSRREPTGSPRYGVRDRSPDPCPAPSGARRRCRSGRGEGDRREAACSRPLANASSDTSKPSAGEGPAVAPGTAFGSGHRTPALHPRAHCSGIRAAHDDRRGPASAASSRTCSAAGHRPAQVRAWR